MSLHDHLSEHFGIRGSINAIGTYLGEYQLSAEEYVRLHPDVPLGLLNALGLRANSVALPTEDTATFVMTAMDNLYQRIEPQDINGIDFIEVGTESIKDGSLPLSQYALSVLSSLQQQEGSIIPDDVMSTESKHACIGAMNAIWKNLGDNGVVIAADIATYNDDEGTASSADFTGGAGSVALHLLPASRGLLLDIFNVRGVSAGLTYDFFKPYRQKGLDIESHSYPVVFGAYSNLANIERVAKAYLNLVKRVNGLRLNDFNGVVLHAPYPGITKYNLAALFIIDQALEDEEYITIQKQLFEMIDRAHASFQHRDFGSIKVIERDVKTLLKEVMAHNTHDYGRILQKNAPSLQLISQTGNLYTGSSPLCMLSLLEYGEVNEHDLILWGGYGSGNQAIFMIASVKSSTHEAVSEYKTQKMLDRRNIINAEYYKPIKYNAGSTELDLLQQEVNGMGKYITPSQAYFVHDRDEFGIAVYQKQFDGPITKILQELKDAKLSQKI